MYTELQFERERKRRRLYRESSVDLVEVETNVKNNSQSEQSNHVLNPCLVPTTTDNKAKCRFLAELGLEVVSAECRRRELLVVT